MSKRIKVETSTTFKTLSGDDIGSLVTEMEKLSEMGGYRPITGSILFSYGGKGKAASKLSFVIVMTRNLKAIKRK